MPAKYFYISKEVDKDIIKLPLAIQNRIEKAFDLLKENPLLGIKLHGQLKGYSKFRIGDYRIVYKFSSKRQLVEVVKVEHRQGVYR